MWEDELTTLIKLRNPTNLSGTFIRGEVKYPMLATNFIKEIDRDSKEDGLGYKIFKFYKDLLALFRF
jgi:hypothetical protein